MGGEHIPNILVKLYPIPSGLAIGSGALGLIISGISLPSSDDLSAQRWSVLIFSIMILAGWLFSFQCPRRLRKSTDLKAFGIGFVGMGFLLFIATLWTPDPNEVGECANINPYALWAIPYSLFVVPISYLLFWLGVIKDTIPRSRQVGYYPIAFIPILILCLGFLSIIVIDELALVLIIGYFPVTGFFCILLSWLLYRSRKRVEGEGGFYGVCADSPSEEDLKKMIDDSGFRG